MVASTFTVEAQDVLAEALKAPENKSENSQNSHLFPCYAPYGVAFVRGEGARLFDGDNNSWIDFSSGIGVVSLGHANPLIVDALTRQAQALWHLSNLHTIEGQHSLARKIAATTFADRTFFTNSGTEAIECAIKTARRFQLRSGDEKRYRIITFNGAFHGRSLGACSAGGSARYLDGMGPGIPGFDQLPFGNLEAVESTISDETAAILVETIQGEGGIRESSSGFLQGLRALCDSNDLLLILDEIQCGMGRTGDVFAFEASGIVPDIVTIAKGLGAGFPVGACLVRAPVADVMTPGTHGSTHGGNCLAMAVAEAVWDRIAQSEFRESVRESAAALRADLQALIADERAPFEGIRGRGLMIGLMCGDGADAREVVSHLRHFGVLTVPAAENVVRVLPPLTMTTEEREDGVERMRRAYFAH